MQPTKPVYQHAIDTLNRACETKPGQKKFDMPRAKLKVALALLVGIPITDGHNILREAILRHGNALGFRAGRPESKFLDETLGHIEQQRILSEQQSSQAAD